LACINNRCILDAIRTFGKVFSLDMNCVTVILLAAHPLRLLLASWRRTTWGLSGEMMIMLPLRLKQFAVVLACLLLALATACSRQGTGEGDGRLRIVTTIFPLYDFARAIGGEGATVQLLLPPGAEAHNFEPKPEDVVRVSKAQLFIFTNAEMEPWGEALYRSAQGNGAPRRIEAGAGARYLAVPRAGEADGHGHGHDQGGRDPHIWLNIANARLMVDNIAAGMVAAAPAQRELFLANAAAYKKRLDELENRFRTGLATCRTREFIHGGHYAFAYLADSYNLTYLSAYGITADSEPSPRRMMELVKTVREHGLKTIFFEELLSPRLAETVATETGAQLVRLHGIHNVTRQDLDAGASYLGLMEQNLTSLRKGIECR
jgi:zinc transport system substrate-binding protein